MKPQVYLHYGSSALSEYRSRSLASKIGATQIKARYLHFVDLHEELVPAEQANLDFLLTYDDVPPDSEDSRKTEAVGAYTHKFYVIPRQGTISPWSSKATDIAHVAGLGKKVKRIERGVVYFVEVDRVLDEKTLPSFTEDLHDRMVQKLSRTEPDLEEMFAELDPMSAKVIPILEAANPVEALEQVSQSYGLGLDASEISYLVHAYSDTLNRDPYLEELFMWSQINSEHCRHKTFNAEWVLDGQEQGYTLFEMIKETFRKSPQHVISAYSDNAAVMEGSRGSNFAPEGAQSTWKETPERVFYSAKVESHCHPTTISPWAGAATGAGGEIRDENAVGRGGRPHSSLCGFAVSDLNIPGFGQPWELDVGKPHHIASSLQIMIDGPLGSASFSNEFGRPCTLGFFRTLTIRVPIDQRSSEIRGFHKCIMLSGGVGQVRPQMALKDPKIVPAEAPICIIGGPAMLIGLGGGSASSVAGSDVNAELDFASVQRANPEVQRRAHEVLTACSNLGGNSPVLFLTDLGAGGLANGVSELVHDCNLGAEIQLRDIESAEPSMSPMQVWCCEAQERYALIIAPDKLETFKAIAKREKCAYSIIGKTTNERRLILLDRDSRDHPAPIDVPMSVLFAKPTKTKRRADTRSIRLPAFDNTLGTYLPKVRADGLLQEAANRVLNLPSVGSKSFLITIGDRTVGGLTARDQMVGPFQTPVSNVSVTATSLTIGIKTGVAMAIGEKPMLALISPEASVKMALAESLLNLSAACIEDRLSKVTISANWMCAVKHPGEEVSLYNAVKALGKMCEVLRISIPTGKDSTSMAMKWSSDASTEPQQVTAPLTLVATAYAPVKDINKTWTPTLRRLEDVGETSIMLVDLALGRKGLGGSALAQTFRQVGSICPDVHDVQLLADFFDAMEQLQDSGIVLASHDRSDGGLFTALSEMMFAGRCGMDVMLDPICPSSDIGNIIETLFNEELAVVFQIRKEDERDFNAAFATCGPPRKMITKIGRVSSAAKQELTIYHGYKLVYRQARGTLQQRWASTSNELQSLRDNPICAEKEHACLLDDSDPGLSYKLTFSPASPLSAFLNTLSLKTLTSKPQVAILREQGINGASEMAFAFLQAAFTPVDVHMTDLFSSRINLSQFTGLAACGGFSYGDVLGAGQGWAKSVLLNSRVRAEFKTFFERPETFTLGVCNGCQFLTRLKQLIPGSGGWCLFERNRSEQYEARFCMVQVLDPPDRTKNPKPCIFLQDMHGSALPIAVAHGEGRASFYSSSLASSTAAAQNLLSSGGVALRYVDNYLRTASSEAYPANPNGSPLGIAGVRSADGKVFALMPHPERTILAGVGSWTPQEITHTWTKMGPWSKIFENARKWVG